MSIFDTPFDTASEAALVTGAGNGIGRAIAQALIGEGVRTMFADVNRETVTAAIKASARPELAVPFVGDLGDAATRTALLAEAAAALGRVTHFVHSASPPRREADHAFGVSSETWAQMHAVNLEAGFHLSRELARKLIADKQPGSFLLLTSLHAGTPRNLPHYSTSKAGLSMLVKELAKTFGRFSAPNPPPKARTRPTTFIGPITCKRSAPVPGNSTSRAPTSVLPARSAAKMANPAN